jgi:hypothetical protein
MEAPYAGPPIAVELAPGPAGALSRAKAASSRLLRFIAERARDRRLDDLVGTPPMAQFAALSRKQQSRLLDRGYRP